MKYSKLSQTKLQPPQPPPPSYQEPEKEIPLYTAVVKPKPPVVAAKPVLPTKTEPELTVDSNRAKSASPIPSNTVHFVGGVVHIRS